MKILMITLLLIFAPPSFAIQKCVVDGKVVYHQGKVCTQGIQKNISGGTLSGITLSGINWSAGSATPQQPHTHK
ncbi:hypothetical protein [Methylomonas sp. AM2-LC]|uniref:hypothetical protein n=1 Tax=Methylomonas sp. AM2-LC TaxID=3153301 RepID=UPI0032674800